MTYPALSAVATWACLPRLCPLDIASPLVQSARASAGSVPRQRSLRERLDAAPSRRAPPRGACRTLEDAPRACAASSGAAIRAHLVPRQLVPLRPVVPSPAAHVEPS
eukprot:CAMPEP_0202757226 /NCGR_PEP_ID=MMETSP1388-20130828/16233_1 /ASSEMBLY_ACC=CAM_ASM_000864 /TAXON_ID=37098 /ORGANISM="Isochrysis sp, Strain CCMP1244" /LENGTH=106 /DNA_ID=CAMNT_0049425109 /DNA_START=260 /DNA_END=577 /DNA_ORIENTATION=-